MSCNCLLHVVFLIHAVLCIVHSSKRRQGCVSGWMAKGWSGASLKGTAAGGAEISAGMFLSDPRVDTQGAPREDQERRWEG